MALVRAEAREYSSLRPRNEAVPSNRPQPSGGSTPRVGRFIASAGEQLS